MIILGTKLFELKLVNPEQILDTFCSQEKFAEGLVVVCERDVKDDSLFFLFGFNNLEDGITIY